MAYIYLSSADGRHYLCHSVQQNCVTLL